MGSPALSQTFYSERIISEPEVLALASYFRAGEGRQECEQEKKPFPDGVAFSHDVWR